VRRDLLFEHFVVFQPVKIFHTILQPEVSKPFYWISLSCFVFWRFRLWISIRRRPIPT